MTSGPLNHKERFIINQAIEQKSGQTQNPMDFFYFVENRLNKERNSLYQEFIPNSEKCCNTFFRKKKSQNENMYFEEGMLTNWIFRVKKVQQTLDLENSVNCDNSSIK